jgi:hypothetical protein
MILVVLLAAALFLSRHLTEPAGPPEGPLPTYTAREAADHAGEDARVCGRVVDTAHAAGTRGRPTFLNLEEPYPDPVFTVLIWGDDRGAFPAPPERAYRDRRICVRGRIQLHEGRPEIVARSPAQIEMVGSGG